MNRHTKKLGKSKRKTLSNKKYTVKNLLNKLKKLRILGKSKKRSMKGG
tara:strand:+ start:3137 stop:3280 length:144 start_codon:yes stop_codon:yes gene_type:complete